MVYSEAFLSCVNTKNLDNTKQFFKSKKLKPCMMSLELVTSELITKIVRSYLLTK